MHWTSESRRAHALAQFLVGSRHGTHRRHACLPPLHAHPAVLQPPRLMTASSRADARSLPLQCRSKQCGAAIVTPKASHTLTCGNAAGVQARYVTLRIPGTGKVLAPCEVAVYGPGAPLRGCVGGWL